MGEHVKYPYEYKPWGIFGSTYIIKDENVHSKVKRNDNLSYIIMLVMSIISLNIFPAPNSFIAIFVVLCVGVFINNKITRRITSH